MIERKRRYRELRGPIDWLEAARLVRKCHPVDGRPRLPLRAQARENIFKLYLFDVGLLGHMLGLTYADQHAQDFAFKGYVAENFVQTELSARVGYPTFGWEQAQAEVEFLHRARDGEIVPVEVKSGSRTRARSLRSYIARYEPRRAIKLVGGPGGGRRRAGRGVAPVLRPASTGSVAPFMTTAVVFAGRRGRGSGIVLHRGALGERRGGGRPAPRRECPS